MDGRWTLDVGHVCGLSIIQNCGQVFHHSVLQICSRHPTAFARGMKSWSYQMLFFCIFYFVVWKTLLHSKRLLRMYLTFLKRLWNFHRHFILFCKIWTIRVPWSLACAWMRPTLNIEYLLYGAFLFVSHFEIVQI